MTPPERHAAVLEALGALIDRSRAYVPAQIVRGMEGCRRILQRHAPEPCTFGTAEHATCVSGCGCEWPCADWLDAAAGLPGEDTPDDTRA